MALLRCGVPGQALPEAPCGPAGGARREGHVAGDAGGRRRPYAPGAASPHTPPSASGLAGGGPGGMALTPAVHLTPAHVHSAVRGNRREVQYDCSAAVGATQARDSGATRPRAADPGGRRASRAGVHAAWSPAGSRSDPAEPVGPAQGRWTRALRRRHLVWALLPLPLSHGAGLSSRSAGRAHVQEKRQPPFSALSSVLPGEPLWAEPRKMAGPAVHPGDSSEAGPLGPVERNWALAGRSPGLCAGPGYSPGSKNGETWSPQAL